MTAEERWDEPTQRLASDALVALIPRSERDSDLAPYRATWRQAEAVLAALADAGLLVSPGWHLDPEESAQLTTYSDGWQYAVATARGDEPLVYGDQYWVSSGRALVDAHPNGRIVRRKVAAYAGPWRKVSP